VAAVAPGMKRGRGRPPKIGGVISRLIMKPKRGRGRPVGRPRKVNFHIPQFCIRDLDFAISDVYCA